MQPEAVVALLNQYVGAMARAVGDNSGVLDKYLGDGLMAIFGVDGEGSAGAQHAVSAALQIRTAIAGINRERASAAIGYGIGIHTGDVVLGSVGIPERADYTAIGDTVNTASRMERLCKEFG